MNNKTKLLFAGILAAFLMLAVPFAVVAFDADDADATVINIDELTETTDLSAGNYKLTGKFTSVKTLNVSGNGTVSIVADEGVKLKGLKIVVSPTVNSNVKISGITSSAGILVKNAGDVTISNCEVTGPIALEEGSKTNGGILVSQSNSATISNNIVTCNETEGEKSFFGVGVQKVMSAVISDNEIYGIDNAVWADMTLPNEDESKVVGSSVTINGNTLEWGSNQDGFDGRGIRSESYDTVMINGNTFILNPKMTIDVGNVAKITFTGGVQFKGNFIGGEDKADCGINFTDSTGKDVYVDIASNFGSNEITVKGLWYLGESITCGTINAKGNITIGSNFTAGEKISINATGNLSIEAVDETNKLSGLIVDGNDNDVTISRLMTESAGIFVSNAGSVNIENCTVSDVNQESVYLGSNIFGIGASDVDSVTIVGCDINNVESTERIEASGLGKDGIGIFLNQIKEEVIIGGQDDTDSNTVVYTGHNAILITLSSADVTIQNNEISDWTSNTIDSNGSSSDEFKAGRALRIVATGKTVTISDNVFSKTYSGALVDLGNVAKITGANSVSFSNNSMSGIGVLETISSEASEVFIDAGTIVVSPTFSKSSESAKYYCYGIKASGTVTIGEGADFILLRGGVLELSEGAALTGTVNGPDGARITFTGIVAGPGGATLTGGSIIAGGMYTSGYVTIDTPGNVLDGTFDDVDITVDDVEVKINDSVVFTNGTSVILNDDASFSEDPVFEAGTKLTIVTGASTEVIQITETSKVSSSGVVRVGFALPIACENGTVYYEKMEVVAITVFEGDSYGQYLAKLGVKADPGYFWNNVFTNEFGTSISSSSIVHEGDKLVATCYSIPISSEAEVEETSGFDIADHVVLIEAVIAVLVLIGFVAYIRKN